MIHFIAAHIWRIIFGWLALSIVFLAFWVWLKWETPEQKESRRRKERAEAARIHLRRVTAVYVARRQREQGLLIARQGEDVLAQVAREWNLDWYGDGSQHDNQVEPITRNLPKAS